MRQKWRTDGQGYAQCERSPPGQLWFRPQEYGHPKNNYITVTRFYTTRDVETVSRCYSSGGNETSVSFWLRPTTYLTHHETRIVL